jgi:hypothetical protein
MRISKPESIEEAIQSKKGHVNPFSLVNDKENKVIFKNTKVFLKVKKVIIDENLSKY